MLYAYTIIVSRQDVFHYSMNNNENLMRVIIQNNEDYEQTQKKASTLKHVVSGLAHGFC